RVGCDEVGGRWGRGLGLYVRVSGGLLVCGVGRRGVRVDAVAVARPGATSGEATRVLGEFLRDVVRLNAPRGNFRVVAPDELVSNRLGALLEATDRQWMAERLPTDDHLSPQGRAMEMLSET